MSDSTDRAVRILNDAQIRVNRVERRLIGQYSAALNATKNADRLVLANTMDSLRLDLTVVMEALEDAMRLLEDEED